MSSIGKSNNPFTPPHLSKVKDNETVAQPPKVDAQGTLNSKATKNVLAPHTLPNVYNTSLKPIPGQAFGSKLTDPNTLKFSAAKEVNSALQKTSSAPPKGVDTAQDNLNQLRTQLDQAIQAQKNVRKEQSKDPQFFDQLLARAKVVKDLKGKVAEAEAALEKLDASPKALKSAPVVGKEIPKSKSDYIMEELKKTEKNYLGGIKELNSFLGSKMSKDKEFEKELYDTKIVIERHIAKAAKFENRLSAAKNLEGIIKCYEEGFSEYSESMAEYASITEKLQGYVNQIELKSHPEKSQHDLDRIKGEVVLPIQRMPRIGLMLADLKTTITKDDPLYNRLDTAHARTTSSTQKIDHMATSLLRMHLESLIINFRPRSRQTLSLSTAVLTQRPSKDKVNVGVMLSEIATFAASSNPLNKNTAQSLFEQVNKNPALVNFIISDKDLKEKFAAIPELLVK